MKKQYLALQLFGISLFAVAQSTPLAHITIQEPSLACSPGICTTLTTAFSTLKSTTNYQVASIPFNPLFPYTGGTLLNNSADDLWTPAINLPFSFCFFGSTYNSVLVGSNGVMTFDLTNQTPSGYCSWPFTQTIPNATFPIRNAIYGVYQDSNISSPPVTNALVQNVNYYILDSGLNAAPNRVFVVNFNQLPQYQCNAAVGLQTSQIVIYETTNIIDVYVQNRTACTSWNSGSGLIGIQNQAGTLAVTPAARNTGTWSATNEAWRFSPDGGNLPYVFSWYDNGVLMPDETSSSIVVCPVLNDNSYTVNLSVITCNNAQTVLQSNAINQLLVIEPAFESAPNLIFCTQEPPVYIADLASNGNVIVSGLNANDYTIRYYESLADAENSAANYILDPSNYSFIENKTIYVSLQEELQTGCHYVKSFELTIIPLVTAPTGDISQNFTNGQTLANLVVTGENIIWYDSPADGNVLPTTTLLQNNTTYYATQSVDGCESNRNTNANRFAVTTFLVLSNSFFSTSAFSVYPNPVHDLLTITAQEILKSIVVYNAVGQQILSLDPDQKELQINTAKFTSGVYFLKLNTETESRILKVLKK
ncbi:MAG: T9SS type A sorting domain-containing protein [Burkholderiales bacterium]|nr:T9SS type A sorting domain-containing protein [Flavobacterium sp.]